MDLMVIQHHPPLHPGCQYVSGNQQQRNRKILIVKLEVTWSNQTA
jgi:hypothetical protein